MDQNVSLNSTLDQEQDANSTPPVELKHLSKRIINILLSIISLVFVTVMFYSASTFAFFTKDSNSDANMISSGSLDMDIVEMTDAGEVTMPLENEMRMLPAATVPKIVKVRNLGTLPISVRVKIDVSIDKDESELPENWRELIHYDFNLDDEATEAVEGLWVYRDGYYYYTLPVESGKVTTALFESITFSSDMGNEFANSKISITVTCQATQEGVDVWPDDANGLG